MDAEFGMHHLYETQAYNCLVINRLISSVQWVRNGETGAYYNEILLAYIWIIP